MSWSLLPLLAICSLRKRKKQLEWGQINKVGGGQQISNLLPFPKKHFTIMAEYKGALPHKRNQLSYSQNCGLMLKIQFNNLSSICTLNSVLLMCLHIEVLCRTCHVYQTKQPIPFSFLTLTSERYWALVWWLCSPNCVWILYFRIIMKHLRRVSSKNTSEKAW